MLQRRQSLHQSWRETPGTLTISNRPPPQSLWLAAAGRPGKTAEVPSAYCNNKSSPRHDSYLRGFKTSDHAGNYGALRRAYWGSQWEEPYQELVEECRERGWKTFYEPIDVGCRGFSGRSLCKVLSRLGVTGAATKRAIQSASKAAEKATRCFWIKRGLIRGLLLGRKSGLDQPRLGRLGEGVWCCETRNTQWSQDTSLRMHPSASMRCFLHRYGPLL